MAEVDDARLEWRTSTYSGGGNDCVEVAFTPCGTALRDTKNRAAGMLTVPAQDWTALLTSARSGELDLP
ncbi:DUF397 domain-containing protein [Prauserella flavalba]|uniref:DUF397 domain-containing protein n=1 Tax=Prauserella flavalba TaxID=1477506 RepID=A0A318LL96_9PSEU|nr:DUF397 domain-containing protein [Prauserella flavalba]PXY24546.1 DUF397 domain-containing protein [Prauserella flavalba]